MSKKDVATKPAAKRVKADYTTSINVLVGPDEKPYVVHEGIITHHSAFFRAACSGKFKESVERIVRLPEAKLEAWDILLHWVYTKEIVILDPSEVDKTETYNGGKRFTILGQLYVLADQLDIRELRNAAIDSIITFMDESQLNPSSTVIKMAYEHTSESSMLRKLIQDSCREGTEKGWLEECRHMLPSDFIFGLALTTQESYTKELRIYPKTRCRYHEHVDGEPKCG